VQGVGALANALQLRSAAAGVLLGLVIEGWPKWLLPTLFLLLVCSLQIGTCEVRINAPEM
jgi:hypothetical protein